MKLEKVQMSLLVSGRENTGLKYTFSSEAAHRPGSRFVSRQCCAWRLPISEVVSCQLHEVVEANIRPIQNQFHSSRRGLRFGQNPPPPAEWCLF